MNLTENFRIDEVACRCGCGYTKIDMGFLNQVQELRNHYGRPMVITSGLRCTEHNKKVGGSKDSFHLIGKALDVQIDNALDRYDFLRLAVIIFKGIGVHQQFVHIDGRQKNQSCWTY